MRNRYVPQVKLYDKDGKEILIIENHNGAFALKLIDETYSLLKGARLKETRPSFVMIDELSQFN